MLDKNELTRDTLRMFKSEVQKFEIDNRETIDDAKALQIINKMIKQRKDSIAQFTSGGRADLAEKEQSEVEVLSKYIRSGGKILETPIKYRGRTYEDGKKIRIKDGLNILFKIIKFSKIFN